MQYSPVLFPHMLSTTILLAIAAYAATMWRQPVARLFAVTMFFCAAWAALASFEIASVSLAEKILCMKLRQIPLTLVPAFWLVLVGHATGRTRFLTGKRIIVFFIEPAITIALAIASGESRLFRYGYRLGPAGLTPALLLSNGPLFWVHLVYTYLVLAMSLALVAGSMRDAHATYRRRSTLIIVALLLPPVVDLLYGVGVTTPPGISLVPVALMVSGVLAAIAFLWYRLPEILPIASGLLFRTIDDAGFILDRKGSIVDVNASAVRLLGGGTVTPVGGLLDALPAPWGDALSRFASGPVAHDEIIVGEPPGARFYSLSLSHLKDEKDRLHGSLLLLHDMTAGRLAREEERRNRERLQLAFDAATDGLWDWDLRSNTVYWSPRYFTMIGYQPGEIPAGYESFKSLLHPDDIARADAGVTELLTRGRETNASEFRMRAKDGTWRWIFSKGRVVERAPDGRAARLLGTHADITERRVMEESLRESEERFRGFIEQSAEAIMVVAEDGRIIEFNPTAERMTGLNRKEALSSMIWDLMSRFVPHDKRSADYASRMKKRYLGAFSTGSSDMFGRLIPATLELPDGSVRHFQQHLFPIRTSRGVQIGSISHDITEIKAAEEALRKSEEQLLQAQKMEAIGRLAGGIAHDFNNILTVIGGYCDIVREALPDGSTLRADVGEIASAAEKAASLTAQLLAFSRKQVLTPRVLDPNELVRAMLGLLARVIGEDVELETFLDPDAGRILADPGQIEQVLMNLAVNARDAMPAGGKLSIETADRTLDEGYAREHPEVTPGPYVQISVSDTGTGMNPEILSRIFEPFFTTKEQGKGTGLGLSMAYGIVKQSEGHIFCASEQGKGATFTILLPRAVEGGTAESAGEQDEPERGGGETILLVEDEEAVREFTRAVLAKHGYAVVAAAGGAEALAEVAAGRCPAALLVTDVVMPQMSGRELARTLVEKNPALKVLYISGYTEDAIVRYGILDTGVEFIQKPFSSRDLLAKVREILDRG